MTTQYRTTPDGSHSAFNITAAAVVYTGQGRIVTVAIITASAAAGAIYDASSTSGNTAANQIAAIPANATGTITLRFPFFTGLVVSPGASGVLAVSYSPY